MKNDYTKTQILINVPVPIETDRIILRNAQAGDGQAVWDAKAETFDQLQQWMPWAKELGTVEETEIVCREAHAKFIRRDDLMMLAFERASGKFIGGIGLHRFDWAVRRFEIGYWVRTSLQGNSYATEIANTLTRFAFGALDARAVMIGHAAGNERSRAVIQKLGFDYEGTEKNGTLTGKGSVFDALHYSRTNTKNLPDINIRWDIRP